MAKEEIPIGNRVDHEGETKMINHELPLTY